MSLWIRAICTRSVGHLSPEDLMASLEPADWYSFAEQQGLPDEAGQAAREHTRIDNPRPDADFTLYTLHYVEASDRGIGIERWSGDNAAEELEEMREMLEDAPERIRALLEEATETVAFELKASDARAVGLQVAFWVAMFIAEQGAGLVEYEGSWWDPETWEELA